MNASKTLVEIACAMVVGSAHFATPARAQDPVKVAPDNYVALFENEHVRVCDVNAEPGGKIPKHSHPDHVVYVVSGGKVKFTYPDGQTKDLDQKPGMALWIPAETHEGQNTGKEELHVIVFELKGKAAAGTEPKTKEVPEHAKVLLENERVRMLEIVLKPGEKSAMHSHPANVIYAVTAAKTRFTDPAGKTTEKELAAGQAVWSGPVTHAVENTGDAEVRILNVEFKGLAAGPQEKKP